ncbi:MAG: nucleotidyltransferase domain-containing protein [Nitrincola sp.]|nr:nucleotidyltransferase domain-containing protein [Nitrincola sp.]
MKLDPQQQKYLDELCEGFAVERLCVFGSISRGEERPDSDLDIFVSFRESLSAEDYATNYFALKEALESTFKRPVDLLTQAALKNPFLRQSIEMDQRVLYAA